MDGWGIPEDPKVSAIDAANTPFYDSSLQKYPNTTLRASEHWVGLPDGQMGNSEVGHMNIGAGRVVFQDLERISQEIRSGKMAENPEFQALVDYCEKNAKPLHLLGLLSDGGVHSHIDHLKGLISMLKGKNIPSINIHCFMDGRDTDPNAGEGYIRDLEEHLRAEETGQIASVIGRYYAMDRNQIYERIAKAWKLLVNGTGTPFESAYDAVKASYQKEVTDEFMEPAVIQKEGEPVGKISDGDAVLFFNFRTDRGRQLTEALMQRPFHEEGMHPLELYYTTMTRYDDSWDNVRVIMEKENIQMGLGEILANAGKSQIRIAETEKYPHVTFFFNGGREAPFENEKRFLIPSPSVATYDLQPEMSAFEVRDTILKEIQKGEVDFVCLNFANPDMVGHTGVFDAVVKACEAVDSCTRSVVEAGLEAGYSILVTADHGNADKLFNKDGSPHTAHTTSLVPLILYHNDPSLKLKSGKLGDLAPTILSLMGLDIPSEMSGEILITDEKAAVTA